MSAQLLPSDSRKIDEPMDPIERGLFDLEELSTEKQSSAESDSDGDASSREMATDGIDLQNKYTYFRSIPKLEDMAALSISLDLWNNYYSNCDGMYFPSYELEKVNENVDKMKVPKCIREKIKKICAKIQESKRSYYSRVADLREMCNCDDEYDDDDNDGHHDERRHFYPYGAVWYSNGSINVKKTAEKVLSCPRRLNDNDLMFEIISSFCLENYIKEFPLNSLSEKFIESVREKKCSHYKIIDYWIKYKENANLNVYGAEYSYDHELLNDLRNASYQGEWSVYEYFWNFFDDDEQVTMTRNLIRSNSFKHHQLNIFFKMNKFQLWCLYLNEPVAIIVNFLLLEELELAEAAWEYVKEMIEEEKFELLIITILYKDKKLTEDWHTKFLIDLWNSAPANLIEYVISKNCEIVTRFFDKTPKIINASTIEFLKNVLSRTTLEFRLKFFTEKGPFLILKYLHVLKSLIEHCLNTTDRMKIMENLLLEAIESKPAGIMYRFRDLLYSSHEEFTEFLTFFTLKPTLQVSLKKRLLQSRILIIKELWKTETWAQLSQFINELYLDQEKEALRQKKKMIFSFLSSFCSYMDCYRPNGDEKFAEIDDLMAQYLTPEQIRNSKQAIINNFRKVCYRNSDFFGQCIRLKRMNIPRFASWCFCGDKEKIERFRISFPIHEVYRCLLREIVERYINGRDVHLSFSVLQELLQWKFQTNRRKIKKFKKRKIHSILKDRVFSLRGWKMHKYPNIVKKFVSWTFDDNKLEIRKFEQRYSKEYSMHIICWLHFDEETTDCAQYYNHTSDDSE